MSAQFPPPPGSKRPPSSAAPGPKPGPAPGPITGSFANPAAGAAARGAKRPVTVVGAGFSGLAAAFYLSRAGFQVEVVEERESPGGMIATLRTPIGLVETAANAFLNSQKVEELFGLIGLELVHTKDEAKKRFIFRRGSPRRWPIGPIGSLRLLAFVILYFVFRPGVAPKAKESVRDWSARVMGAEAGQYLVEAALQGIYAGDPTRMSARLVFHRFFTRTKRPPAPKKRGSVTAREGMGQVMERLRERLKRQGVQFIFSQSYRAPGSLPKQPIIIATSPHAAAEILRDIDPVRAKACENVEMLPLVSVTIGFRDPPPHARGFGCLFPPIEGMRALGVLMNTFIFPGRTPKGYSETWMFGGARSSRGLVELADEQLVAMAIEERQGALHAGADHFGFRVTRWPKALPHYTGALEEALPELKGLRRNTILIGNYLGDIGLTRILERAARLPAELSAKGEWVK